MTAIPSARSIRFGSRLWKVNDQYWNFSITICFTNFTNYFEAISLVKTKKNRGGGLSADFRGKRISQMKQTPKTLQSLLADSKWRLVLIRSLVSAIHVCVQHHTCVRHILAHTFLPAARLLFCWRDFSLLVWLSFAGATFFRWRDFIFAGATLFRWRDFFLKRSFVDRC